MVVAVLELVGPLHPEQTAESKTTIVLEANPFIIGRNVTSNCIIQNPCVSGVHCVFTRIHQSQMTPSQMADAATGAPGAGGGGGLTGDEIISLADMSTNGCHHNGVRLGRGKVVTVRDGDQIDLVVALRPEHAHYNIRGVFRLVAGGGTQQSDASAPFGTPPPPTYSTSQHPQPSPLRASPKAATSTPSPLQAVPVISQDGVAATPLSDPAAAAGAAAAQIIVPASHPEDADFNNFAQPEVAIVDGGAEADGGPKYFATVPVTRDYDMNYNRPLGSGSFATVYVATSRTTGHEYAVKEVDKTRKKVIGDPNGAGGAGAAETPQMRAERIRDRERQQREVEILLSVSHPHVASCAAVYETDERLWFVMPFARGGDVFSFMNRRKIVTEDEVRSIVHQVAAALAYLHAAGIVHRDIKLENLLLLHPDPNPAAGEWTAQERQQRLRSLHVLVSDFGLSRIVRNDGSVILTMCGTPVYVAPEVVCVSLRGGEGYTPAVDMFSLGVVAYALLTRRPPFPFAVDPRTGERTKNKIQYNAALVWPEAAGVSAAARRCVEAMLSLDPARRPSAAEVLATPWVAEAPSKQQPTAFGAGALGPATARKRERDE